jgi:tetratricopeptide (TPR) repeat protein
LAHFRQGSEAVEYIELAVTKFEDALKLDARKHDALWCLGNALTSQGFLFADAATAAGHFASARSCFERALAEQPDNEVYRKALDMTSRAPALHAELQKQFAAQQQAEAAAGGGGGSRRGSRAGGGGGDGDGASREPHDWLIDYAGYASAFDAATQRFA